MRYLTRRLVLSIYKNAKEFSINFCSNAALQEQSHQKVRFNHKNTQEFTRLNLSNK